MKKSNLKIGFLLILLCFCMEQNGQCDATASFGSSHGNSIIVTNAPENSRRKIDAIMANRDVDDDFFLDEIDQGEMREYQYSQKRGIQQVAAQLPNKVPTKLPKIRAPLPDELVNSELDDLHVPRPLPKLNSLSNSPTMRPPTSSKNRQNDQITTRSGYQVAYNSLPEPEEFVIPQGFLE
ncbi:MAG: hypothetical protein ACRCUY_11205, partial [Thermoguttaceae bacterium]